MMNKVLHGVYAAVLSPRDESGGLDFDSLRALIWFLRERGISQYAINGATGEFCLTSSDELRQILSVVREAGDSETEILCGVGAADIKGCLDLMSVAERAEVKGVLLPMPYFFPYSQDDLYTFSTTVAATTSLPVLLYNLPQFTSGLEPETVCRLIEDTSSIVGVKDSSGSLEIVTALTERLPAACRIIGNDSVLATAMAQDLCDGVVSGVACVLPELVSALYQCVPGSPEFIHCKAALDVFLEQLNVFPTPWGLKWAAEAQGVLQAHFALPQSDHRMTQAREFQSWLKGWLPTATTGRILTSSR